MKWKKTDLGEVCTIIAGGTPKRSEPSFWEGEIPWVKISDMLQGRITKTEERITNEGLEQSAAKLLPAGTVLVSIFATIGRTATLGVQATTNQAIVGVIPKREDTFDLRFLEYCLENGAIDLKRRARGVAQANINGSVLKQLKIPLPPLEEQKRIAGILDAADRLRAQRRETLAQLDTLLQSTFLELFGDPVTNPKGWEVVKLGDNISIRGGYAFKSGDILAKSDAGIPLIRIGEVNRKEFDPRNMVKLPRSYLEKHPNYIVKRGQIVMSLTGTVGKDDYGNAVFIDGSSDEYLLNQRVAEITPGDDIDPIYLVLLLAQPDVKRILTGRSRGVRQANISNKDVTNLRVPLPTLDLQRRFAAIVESVEKQKTRQRAHLAELDALFASLQSRAFNGEL